MKRILLVLVLAVAMLVAAVPSAFALTATGKAALADGTLTWISITYNVYYAQNGNSPSYWTITNMRDTYQNGHSVAQYITAHNAYVKRSGTTIISRSCSTQHKIGAFTTWYHQFDVSLNTLKTNNVGTSGNSGKIGVLANIAKSATATTNSF